MNKIIQSLDSTSIQNDFQKACPDLKVIQLIPINDSKIVIMAAPIAWKHGDRPPLDCTFAYNPRTHKIYEYSPTVELDIFNEASKNAVDVEDAFLMHYGVKGQKWGVRNWQNSDGTLTEAGKIHYGFGTGGREYGVEVQFNQYLLASDSNRREVAKTSDGSYVESALLVGNDPRYFNGQKGITNSDLRMCNKEYGASGTTRNCVKCSATMELINQGYTDIEAGRLERGTYSEAAFGEWWPGSVTTDVSKADSKKFFSEEIGPNASGVLGFIYQGGAGGHEVHWTTDENGAVEIQDGQCGKRMGYNQFLQDYYVSDRYAMNITRLDNVKPNFENMAKDSVVRIKNNSQILDASDGEITKKYRSVTWEEQALNKKVTEIYNDMFKDLQKVSNSNSSSGQLMSSKNILMEGKKSTSQKLSETLNNVSISAVLVSQLAWLPVAGFLEVGAYNLAAVTTGLSLATFIGGCAGVSAADKIQKTKMSEIADVLDSHADELKDVMADLKDYKVNTY